MFVPLHHPSNKSISNYFFKIMSQEKPSCCCTAITWKPAMNLTRYNDSSFFSWFCSQSDASTDDIAEVSTPPSAFAENKGTCLLIKVLHTR